jgi:hypothetical protein
VVSSLNPFSAIARFLTALPLQPRRSACSKTGEEGFDFGS